MSRPLFTSDEVKKEDRLSKQLSQLDQTILFKIIGYNVIPSDYQKLHEAYIKSDVYKKIVLDRIPNDPINFSLEIDNARVLTNDILTGVSDSPEKTGSDIQNQIKTDRLNQQLSQLDVDILQRILAGSTTIPANNIQVNQDTKKNVLADVTLNQYTSSNRYNDNILTSLSRQRDQVLNFINNNPIFTLKRQALYALDIPERAVMNPLSPALALLPGVGGNIRDTIAGGIDVPLVGDLSVSTEPYFKHQDRNKITYSDIYNGTFVKRGGSLVDLATKKASSAIKKVLGVKGGGTSAVPDPDLNEYTEKHPKEDREIKENSTFINVDGNKIQVKSVNDISLNNLDGFVDQLKEDNYYLTTFDHSQYIDDVNEKMKQKYDNYIQPRYSPKFQSLDKYEDIREQTLKKFYFVSNINETDNINIFRQPLSLYEPDLNDKYMILLCGIQNEIVESYGASWISNDYIGNSQAIPLYQSTTRNSTITMLLYADIRLKDTSGDARLAKFYSDLDSYTTRINWLAQHMYPLYTGGVIDKAPYLKMTLGNLFQDQIAILKTLDITWHQKWDVNDNIMFPMLAEVTLNMDLIQSETPSSQSVFYKLF